MSSMVKVYYKVMHRYKGCQEPSLRIQKLLTNRFRNEMEAESGKGLKSCRVEAGSDTGMSEGFQYVTSMLPLAGFYSHMLKAHDCDYSSLLSVGSWLGGIHFFVSPVSLVLAFKGCG